MKLLIVEGNTEHTRLERGAFGIQPYHVIFKEMLLGMNPTAEIEVAFPADENPVLPSVSELKIYDGVLWTGSSLSVLDTVPAVQQQLDFANDVFESGVPLYGSCWGLQVATVVAGGVVAKGNNGLELAASKSIELTKEGKLSSLFNGRTKAYQSLCIHFDEVSIIPKNATILAFNAHSKVQALVFKYKNSEFFGVQYHPEFRTSTMGLIVAFLKEKLIENNYFSSEATANELIDSLKNQENLPEEIIDYKQHTQEIESWIKQIKK